MVCRFHLAMPGILLPSMVASQPLFLAELVAARVPLADLTISGPGPIRECFQVMLERQGSATSPADVDSGSSASLTRSTERISPRLVVCGWICRGAEEPLVWLVSLAEGLSWAMAVRGSGRQQGMDSG